MEALSKPPTAFADIEPAVIDSEEQEANAKRFLEMIKKNKCGK